MQPQCQLGDWWGGDIFGMHSGHWLYIDWCLPYAIGVCQAIYPLWVYKFLLLLSMGLWQWLGHEWRSSGGPLAVYWHWGCRLEPVECSLAVWYCRYSERRCFLLGSCQYKIEITEKTKCNPVCQILWLKQLSIEQVSTEYYPWGCDVLCDDFVYLVHHVASLISCYQLVWWGLEGAFCDYGYIVYTL